MYRFLGTRLIPGADDSTFIQEPEAVADLQAFITSSSQASEQRDALHRRHAFELAVASLLQDRVQSDSEEAEMYAITRNLANQATDDLLETWSSLSPLLTGPRERLMQVSSLMLAQSREGF